MALALFTPLQKNRKAFTDNLLLNSKRVVDFKKSEQYPLSQTILYMDAGEGERGGTWEWVLNHSLNTVSTRLFEDETNPFIYVEVLGYVDGSGREKATSVTQRQWKINSEAVIYAYDISSTQSYIYLDRGLNWLRLRTSHTVADLSRAFSTSSSLSKS